MRGSPKNIELQPGEPNWVRYQYRHELVHEWIHFDDARQAGWPGVQSADAAAPTEVKAFSWQLAHPEILELESWALPENIISHWAEMLEYWQGILGSQ